MAGGAAGEVGAHARDKRLAVELELAGENADAALPGLRAHLEGCPACREDYESLRALLTSER